MVEKPGTDIMATLFNLSTTNLSQTGEQQLSLNHQAQSQLKVSPWPLPSLFLYDKTDPAEAC